MDTRRRQSNELGTVIRYGRVWNGVSSTGNANGNVPKLNAACTTYDAAVDATLQPDGHGHAAISSTDDDAAITNDVIADVAAHDDAVNGVTNAANGQYSAALDDAVTNGTADVIAYATAYGATDGAAYGTADGTANGSAYGITNGTANAVTYGTTDGSADGTASRSLPATLTSTAEHVRTTAAIPI